MRFIDGFGIEKATELSDLRYGEYKCIECNKIIERSEIITNNRSERITTNGINFCSSRCKGESNKGYDRRVNSLQLHLKPH